MKNFFQNSNTDNTTYLQDWNFWKALLSIASEHVLVIDKEGSIIFTNKRIFDISKLAAVGQNFFAIAPSTYTLILKEKLSEIEKSGELTSFETFFNNKGSQVYHKITIKPLLGLEQEILGFAITSTDITTFKTAQKRYEHKMNLEKLFFNISSKFINLPANEIDNGIEESLELIARFTNSEHAYIKLQETSDSIIDYQWHSVNQTTENSCDVDNLRRIISTIISETSNTLPRLILPGNSEESLKDCPAFVCPMIFEKRYYGALILIGKTNSQSNWSEDFSKPMVFISNVFINTLERKKRALLEKERKQELERIIETRTAEIELQKETLIKQAQELKEAEEKISAAYQELKEANFLLEEKVKERTSSLEKTNQELDRFVYSVSHDIKAPLASVLGLVNLIRLSPENDVEHHLQLMERSIFKLNGFVQDILEYSRNSRLKIKKDPINFKQQIESAREDLKHMHTADGVDLFTSYAITTPVVSDENRLQSVLKNLMSNAIKYHNPSAGHSWVKVEISADTKEFHVKIEDNGIGISKESLPKVFDMFYRASEKSTGSGLGLYIVKETVQKMGGTIRVKSVENKGTTFHLTLPNLASSLQSKNSRSKAQIK